MVTARKGSSRDRVLMMLAFAALAPCAFAQGATPATLSLNTGKEISKQRASLVTAQRQRHADTTVG